MNQQDLRLAIIGLGYVGFPLAIEFSNTRDVIGFDLNKKRIEELQNNFDSTLEISSDVIRSSPKLKYTNS